MAYEKKKKQRPPIKIIAFLAVVIPLVFILLSSTLGRKDFNLPHTIILEFLGPVQGVFSSAVSYVGKFWENYINLVGLSKENEELRRKLQEYQALNLGYREAAATNISLKKSLDLERSFEQAAVSATIIGRDPALWFKTLTINKGSSSGIKKGMPVVCPAGVVGQISNLSPNYAKVLLSIDPNSAIDAIVQNNRVQGIIKGDGGSYKLHYVLKNDEVNKGDIVITSGMGGVFPKGLAIGEVSEVVRNRRGMFLQIDVEPSTDFRKLEYVTVVLKKDPLAE